MKETIIHLLELAIRQKGYANLSMAQISKITGLNKSSLYHYFPGGKTEIAAEILLFTVASLTQAFDKGLTLRTTPIEKMGIALEVLSNLYQNGMNSCFLDIMSIDPPNKNIKAILQKILEKQLQVFKAIFLSYGFDQSQAQKEAITVVARLQGGLVLSRVADQPELFTQQMNQIKKQFNVRV